MSKPRIAFLGLGVMGAGMARRLLGAGFPLTVFNRNPDKARPLASEGAKIASSPADAARHGDLIIEMVADDAASRSLWLGADGALSGAAPGAVCIECSTLTVAWVRELAAAAKERGCEFLDAPVTGSKPQAAAGELKLLVGGEQGALEKARPALSVMGNSVTHLGPVGSGTLLKLVNNFLCGAQVAALAEAFAWLDRGGLDRAQAMEFLVNGAPASPMFKTVSARMTAGDYTTNFRLRLMAKDLGYAIDEAGKRSLNLKTAAAALELFRQAMDSGHGEEDIAAIVAPLLAAK